MDASLIVAAVVVCVAAAVQGLTGTGFGLTAVPPLIVVAPELVPDTVLLLTIAVTGYTAWVERRCIDRTFVRRCVCAAIPGTAVGYAATMLLPARALGIGIAVVVVAAGCAGLAGPRLSVAVPNVWIAGFAAGAFNWVAALPGPPVALAYQHAEGAAFRATLSRTFLYLSLLALAVRYGSGLAHLDAGLRGLVLAGPVLAGAMLARPLVARLPQGIVTRAALALSTAAGVALLVRTVM